MEQYNIEKAKAPVKVKMVRCLICGATFEATLDKCPVCGVGPEYFEPYEEEVLRYYEVQDNTREVLKFPQNIEATRPVYTKAVGRWRVEFTEEDKMLFKKSAGALLVDLGYEDDDDW